MNSQAGEDESWPSSHDDDLEDIEQQIILAAESLESMEVDYDLLGDGAIDDFNDNEFFTDNFYRAADEALRIVDASEIWAGYGADEKDLAQLTEKSLTLKHQNAHRR